MDHLGHPRLPGLGHVEGDGHVGRWVGALEHLGGHPVEEAGAEGAPALAVFDLGVDAIGDAADVGGAEDRAVAQGPGAELHAPLEPGHRMAGGEQLGGAAGHVVEQLPAGLLRMGLAGRQAFLGGVGRPQIGVGHGFDLLPGLAGGPGGGADGGAGVRSGGLHEQLPHVAPGQDALVELDVEGHPAGKGQLAGLGEQIAQVVVDEPQGHLFEQRLHRSGVIHIGIVDLVALPRRPQPLHQLGAEVVTLALGVLPAAQPHHVHIAGVDPEIAPVEVDQPAQIEAPGIAVGGHSHHLELAVEHLEAEIFGDGAIEPAQGVGIVELLDLVDAAVLAPAEEGGGVLALAVDAEDGGLLRKAAQMVGAGSVGQMVLHHLQPGVADAQIGHQLLHPPAVAVITAVAMEDGGERPVGGVPVAGRIMPPGGAGPERDAGVRKSDDIHLFGTDAGPFQAETCRFVRKAPLGVLFADEALLFGGGHQLAVDEERRGRIVAHRAGHAEHDHGRLGRRTAG